MRGSIHPLARQFKAGAPRDVRIERPSNPRTAVSRGGLVAGAVRSEVGGPPRAGGDQVAGVSGGEGLHHLAGLFYHAQGVIVVGLVDAARHLSWWDRCWNVRRTLRLRLLASYPPVRQSPPRFRGASTYPLMRRPPGRRALSMVGASQLGTGSRRTHDGFSRPRITRAATWRRLGYIRSLAAAGTRMVQQ